MKQLSALTDQGLLAPIDLELGGLLARRAAAALPDVDEVRVVALMGALLSAERARGHSCLDLRAIAGTAPWPEGVGPMMPDADTCRSILERSRLCTPGDEPSPLVLDGERLYLYRFHAAERRLAAAVRARLVPRAEKQELTEETVRHFRRLFEVGRAETVNWQAVAAAAAMRGQLTVMTGGPGTGKTTTVARILGLLLQREPGLRVALAAPTGKAAARLAESIRAGAATLPLDDGVRAALPADGHTLHRLLGYQPWSDRFLHGRDRPLAEDVIVVDEASMVDLLMMDALFAAVRPSARVILLGDQDQLASVETGYVLGDLCRAADACGTEYGVEFGTWYERLSGERVPSTERVTPLRDAVMRLRRSYRFERCPGIGELAGAIRAEDAGRVLDVLADERYGEVCRREPARAIEELLEPVVPMIEAYLGARSPEEAMERLSGFRLLCALREGRYGVAGINEGVERWLRRRGVPTCMRWYERRPVLVTANDAATGLFNGDVGVTFGEGGVTRVFFPQAEGGVRGVSPARLPAHETAWAMTVHKAQGSEFARVLLVLPEEESRVLTRELLYTGVTRAREGVEVIASTDVLVAGVARSTVRASGLTARLFAT